MSEFRPRIPAAAFVMVGIAFGVFFGGMIASQDARPGDNPHEALLVFLAFTALGSIAGGVLWGSRKTAEVVEERRELKREIAERKAAEDARIGDRAGGLSDVTVSTQGALSAVDGGELSEPDE